MKKIAYIIVAALLCANFLSFTPSAEISDEQFTHTVFAEEFTATWCVYCPSAAENLMLVYEDVPGEPYYDDNFFFVALITDVNDNKPVFEDCSSYSPKVEEGAPNGSPVIKVHAVDKDKGVNGQVRYSVVQQPNQKGRMSERMSFEESVIFCKSCIYCPYSDMVEGQKIGCL